MPVRFNTSDAPTLVRYTFESPWSVDQFLEVRQQLIRAGELTARSAVLFDLRPMTGSPEIGDVRAELQGAAIRPVCRAFLVNSVGQFDAARHLQALLGTKPVISEIFQDETRALEWLAAITGRAHAIR